MIINKFAGNAAFLAAKAISPEFAQAYRLRSANATASPRSALEPVISV